MAAAAATLPGRALRGYRPQATVGPQETPEEAQANAKGSAANSSAQQLKQRLIDSGMSEAEAHQQASQQWEREMGGGAQPQSGSSQPQQPSPGSGPSSGPSSGGGNYAPYSYDPTGGMNTSDYNLYSESSGRTPISTLPAPSVPYYDGSDLAKQYVNNRNVERNTGDRYEELFQGDASRRRGLENASLLKSNQLQTELERNPGYTRQESNRITGDREDGGNDYRDLLNVDYDSNQLTPEEQARITGDPSAAGNAYDPNILKSSNETAFRGSEGYIQGTQDKLNQGYDVYKDSLNNAIDPSKLGLSRGYQSASDSVLNTTGDRVWDAATNEGLDMSSEYGRQAGMSDQEVADAATMGGQAIGARGRAAVQDLDRSAAASGNASPLAVAAARREFEDQSAVGMADATVNAQLAARKAQRDAATGVEGTRLKAEQYKTGAQIGAGMDLGRFAQGALDTREDKRLASERDISSRQIGSASALSDASRDTAKYTGDQQLQNERDWANRSQDAGKFDQTSRYNADAAAERAASERAAGLAQNRQSTGMTNQDNQFKRGYQVNATISGATQSVADARRQGQQENRQYYQNQQQYQGQQGNQQQQNMLTNRQQTQQGVNAATEGSTGWELGNKNSGNWFTKNVLPALNTASKFKPGA